MHWQEADAEHNYDGHEHLGHFAARVQHGFGADVAAADALDCAVRMQAVST